jgi:plastocyanin
MRLPSRWARFVLVACVLGALGGAARAAEPGRAATTFTVAAGAESPDMAVQINDFIPKPITINVGDTVTWRVDSTEFHTVTFLSGAPQPPFVGPTDAGPAITPLAAFPVGDREYDGTGVRSSGLLNKGETYSLTFTRPGTFEYVCLVHPSMKAQVVVREAGAPADTPAQVEAQIAPHIANDLATRALPLAFKYGTVQATAAPSGGLTVAVAAGVGDGHVALMRFLPQDLTIRVGDQVTWTNQDPEVPHTVTFMVGGMPHPEVIRPVPQPDGPPLLTLNPAVLQPTGGDTFDGTAMAHSGFMGEVRPVTTYTLRFTRPGTYTYVCLLHDHMGMTGTVTVLP